MRGGVGLSADAYVDPWLRRLLSEPVDEIVSKVVRSSPERMMADAVVANQRGTVCIVHVERKFDETVGATDNSS
jgi:hypothetical protein